MATNVVPLTDHIVLKAVEQEEVTTSGVVIPDAAKEAPQHGHVVAVGPGKLSDTGQMIDIDLEILHSHDRICLIPVTADPHLFLLI